MSADPSTTTRTTIGDVELAALPDALGLLGELDDLYPDTPAQAWAPYRALYPELFAGTKWRLPVTCYLLRTPAHTVVVDAGVGRPGVWDWEAVWEGGLPAALAACNVEPRAVDLVVLTDLHVDHVGWLADGGLFPRARYVVHREALNFAREHSRVLWLRETLDELDERGLLDVVDGEAELAPGLTATPLPGHYPGHQGVRVVSGGAHALLVADAAVHPALLDAPGWRYESDHDHVTAAATRQALVTDLVGSEVIVACGHYPAGGIGRPARVEERVVWEPL